MSFSFIFKENRLLVIGGNNNGGYLARPEWINDYKHLNCDVSLYPIDSQGPASSVTQDGIVSCGGYSHGESKNICKRLGESGNWVSFPSMKSGRAYFDMKMKNGRLWAIGGGGGQNSMESIDPQNEEEWTKQSLPFSVRNHCLSELSDHRLIVTGGRNSRVSK